MPDLEIIDNAGNTRTIKILSNLAFKTKYAIGKALYRSGKDLLSEFRRQVLEKNKTGRVYIIKGMRHQSSAPGQTPANITGLYRKSSSFQVDASNQLIFGDSAYYAGFLETGTSRLRPRPGLTNAVASSERNIMRNFIEALEKDQ